jgi:hypothetical protein
MAKDYSSEELASRIFFISMAGVGFFIATVFLFIL